MRQNRKQQHFLWKRKHFLKKYGSALAEKDIWQTNFQGGGYDVYSTDLVNRGYGIPDIDFLKQYPDTENEMDIITNPPYKYAKEFVEHALEISKAGTKVAMFLKLTFLESENRRKMFEKYPPRTVYVSSKRLNCAKNGEFDKYGSSAAAYAWFVWEKGFTGKPIIEWIN